MEDIERVIDENIKSAESFCDIFAGTACVGNYFKKRYKILSNDLLYFSYCIQKGIIENNSMPEFKKLKLNPLEFFNNVNSEKTEELPAEKRFCFNNYSPAGNRMYLTEKNALKIDYTRNRIEEWKKEDLIDEKEYFYLLAVLIEAIPFVSNISGTYGAYNKFWDKRALKDLVLKELDIYNNNKENKAFNKNGNELISEIRGDILYIDPPYNKRQYSSNYHLLEMVARYDFSELKGVSGQPENKVKSDYCKKNSVLSSFKDLIQKARFKHVIVSYSTEGLMEINEIEEVMKSRGTNYKMYEIDYRRFKSRETNSEHKLKELIFYIRKDV